MRNDISRREQSHHCRQGKFERVRLILIPINSMPWRFAKKISFLNGLAIKLDGLALLIRDVG